jgi:hypothetical protein
LVGWMIASTFVISVCLVSSDLLFYFTAGIVTFMRRSTRQLAG